MYIDIYTSLCLSQFIKAAALLLERIPGWRPELRLGFERISSSFDTAAPLCKGWTTFEIRKHKTNTYIYIYTHTYRVLKLLRSGVYIYIHIMLIMLTYIICIPIYIMFLLSEQLLTLILAGSRLYSTLAHRNHISSYQRSSWEPVRNADLLVGR